MKIEYRTGNLFEGEDVRFLVHCCNAQGRMGSGFAKELRARYPGAYEVYAEVHRLDGLQPGQIIPYTTEDDRTIFNLVGQRFYGYDGKRYVSYDALAEGLEAIDTLAPELGLTHLFMPTMGSALAGGSWTVISAIVERYSTNYQPVVYLFDGIVPTN